MRRSPPGRPSPAAPTICPCAHDYSLVEDRWKSADDWPPPSTPTPWYPGEGGRLSRAPPSENRASDPYDVDFAAATGDDSRWDSVFTAGPVFYPGRAARDERLLTYTSAPLGADLEITGHPVVRLHVASSADDGAFFAYLEDVAPDGTVT
jgi:putative CocE/NonD family hydrolase